MSDPDIEIIQAHKKSRSESEKPPTDGQLDIRVHIISINALNTAFSKTRRSVIINICDAGCYLTNFDREDYSKNSMQASIHAATLHSFVIGHFGGKAKEVIRKVQEGNAPKLLKQNTTNPDYDVCWNLHTDDSFRKILFQADTKTRAK